MPPTQDHIEVEKYANFFSVVNKLLLHNKVIYTLLLSTQDSMKAGKFCYTLFSILKPGFNMSNPGLIETRIQLNNLLR